MTDNDTSEVTDVTGTSDEAAATITDANGAVVDTTPPSADDEGTYTAAEGQKFKVYGYYVEVEDLDGSMVQIERTYEDAPRVQDHLAPNERGNLITDEASA